ncbi:hypothetical protein [Elongatibacter sediminis]|uniref:Prolyl 4-hydroxylase alpha subunit Fe(2+) 2OG dioxygenase domain-containing protein n=1 Tax=Elongatibacter sediminis TaxID=3119006 RepID=A0AAW9RHX9_9GAMM
MSGNPEQRTVSRDVFAPPDWLVEQTARQQAMAPYCGLGFKKGRLDSDLHAGMVERLTHNAERFRPETAIDEIQTTEPGVIPVLFHEDPEFNRAVCEALKPMHETWAGMRLTESACYGFRVYQRGSYLHNHVDRTQTHIISSTICVDSRLDEPWPLYLEDIEGRPHQVNLEPGEFVFYEGARLIHGRPWALQGDYYIGMFVHYRPLSLANHSAGTP